jgi:hypothetical protein
MGLEFLNSRLAWPMALRKILLNRKNPDQFATEFQQLFFNRRLGRSDQFKLKFEKNQILMKQLYADIDKSLTSYQRSQIQNRLRSMASDLRGLSEDD